MATAALTPAPSTYQLDDIESLFETLASNCVVKNIAAIGLENKKLRKEYSDLERDNEHTLKQVARLQTSLDAAKKEGQDVSKELQDALKEKKTLDSQYLQAKKKLADNEKNLGDEKAKMQQQVDSVKQELNQERSKLQRLSAFSTKLVPTKENYKHICSIFGSIRTSAVKLAETYLCDDLPLNGINWSSIKSHTALSGTGSVIPLPVSNSQVAKHMRVAAFLVILGHEMRSHIFQPVYLLHDSCEFSEFLNKLAEEDEEAEAYLRSVLLRALVDFKGLQNSVSTKCAQSVIKTVAKCVESLVLEAKRQAFISELKDFCGKACHEWEYIQKLEERVGFESKPHANDLKNKMYWLPLSTTTKSSSPASSPSKLLSNGSAKNATPASKGSKGFASSEATSTPPQSPVDAEKFLDVVVAWPAVAAEMGVILSPGYFLTASEIAMAMMERKELVLSKDEHRAAREGKRKSRAMSNARHSFGEGGNGTSRSGSFLSAQVVNGSRGS